MSSSKVKTLSMILLLVTGCVSKREYTAFSKRKEAEAITFQEQLSKTIIERDSLRARVVLLDSLLAKEKDKNARLAKVMYKSEKGKDSPGRRTKMNDAEAIKSKAVQIYNFCKMVQWPQSFNTDEVVIAVAGDSPMLEQLRTYTSNKTLNNKKLRIIKFDPSDKSPVHVLYIPLNSTSKFISYKNALRNKPTLFITDDSNLYKQGAHISFRENDDKIRYILNKTGAEKAGLKISQELVKFSQESY